VGRGDGLGLGLSIVAAIADAHRAVLDARPGVGGGLDVRVRFPRVPIDQRLVSVDPDLRQHRIGGPLPASQAIGRS
jgi:hypothetical protein